MFRWDLLRMSMGHGSMLRSSVEHCGDSLGVRVHHVAIAM